MTKVDTQNRPRADEKASDPKTASPAGRDKRLIEIIDQIDALTREARQITALGVFQRRYPHVPVSSGVIDGEFEEGERVFHVPDPAAADRIKLARGMRLAAVLETTGKTKRTVYRWMDEQGFPRPEIVRGVAVWNKAAVKTWWEANADLVGRWPTS